jgi:hypothetical protein
VLFSVVGTYGGACSELNNKSRGEIGDVIISLDTSSLKKRKKYEIYHQKVNKHKKKKKKNWQQADFNSIDAIKFEQSI